VLEKVFGSPKLAKQFLFFFTYIAFLGFNLPKNNSFVDMIFILAILILLVLSARKGNESRIAKQQMISWLLIIALPFFSVLERVTIDVNFASFYYQYYAVQDTYTLCLRSFLILCTAIFLLLTLEYLVKYSALNKINLVEFPIIVGFSLFFILSMLSSFNLFGVYISIEGLTFTLYILAGTNYNSQNCLESGLKYFCLGALSSGLLLFGTALIFIMTGTLDFADLRFIFSSLEELPLLLSFSLIFFFFGFWFKLSIFPCHAWTPDVYEGVLTPVTFFFSTVVKVGVFGILVRVLFFLLGTNVFLFFWKPLFLFAATGSIVFGAFGALIQTKIKRFIGYTAINQMGYLFIGISSGNFLGIQASFLYLFFYLIMAFLFFSVLLYINDFKTGKDIIFISQLRLLGYRHKNISFVLALVLFSMGGIPPLVGFFGKFFLFLSAFQAGNHSLVFLGSIMNIFSAFYYLRLIKCMFFEISPVLGKVSVISFSTGFSAAWPFIFDGVLLFFLFILIVSPFFLNEVLSYFYWVSISVVDINLNKDDFF
jgi:NADH-quinone oxidoreductase subunit N